MKILFLPRYGALAGSSRYMTYDYLPFFEARSIRCVVAPLQDDSTMRLRQARGRGEKVSRLKGYWSELKSLARRLYFVVTSFRYDAVVLEKDLVPYFPYFLEWLLFLLNPRVIAYYDEATHTSYAESGRLVRFMTRGKIERIIRNSAHIVVWNPDMQRFALRLNPSVSLVSTGFDLNRYKAKERYDTAGQPIRIGWIGTASGFRYVHQLDGALRDLALEYPIELFVVSSEDFTLDGVPVENNRWSLETEVDDLKSMDIGIMPLTDDAWSAGKSGCKMLQYMGVGVPAVVSPVGINNEIVEDGVNGFLAATDAEWKENLAALIKDTGLRQEIGVAGRRYIELHNSLEVMAKIITDAAMSVAAGKPVPAIEGVETHSAG